MKIQAFAEAVVAQIKSSNFWNKSLNQAKQKQ